MFIFHKVSYQHLTTPLQCTAEFPWIPYQHLVAPTCHIMLHHHSVPASYLTRVPYQHIAKTPYRTSISSRNTNDSLHHCIAPIYIPYQHSIAPCRRTVPDNTEPPQCSTIISHYVLKILSSSYLIIISCHDPKTVPLNRTTAPYHDPKTVPSYRTMTSKPYPPIVPRSKHPNSHLLWKFIKNTYNILQS